MNKLNFMLLLSTIYFLSSCKYEPIGNNFVELTPPEDYIPIEISLNDVNPFDTIYVYRNTSISIKIKSSMLRQAVILLDEQEYKNMWNNSLDFILYPEQISEGIHKLTVNAIFTSGTGSLAEMMGFEGYIGELSWYICVIHNPQDHFEVGYHINKEGFLEIYWKNVVPENIIEKYTINAETTQITIDDATRKFLVDYGYVCGYAFYEVRTYLQDGYSFSQRLSFDTPTPNIYFEDLGLDNLRIYWDKPFANGRFTLKENYSVNYVTNDTTITISQIFGRDRQFSLEIRPQKAEYNNLFKSAWGRFCQGVSLGLPNRELYAYNTTENIIYTRKYNNLVAFDANTLQEINTVSIMGNPWGFAYGGKVAAAPHNSTVAAMTGEETWIFVNSHFINPIKILSLPGRINTRLSALTSDDRFFVVQKDSNICEIFNSLTGEKIFEFSFTYTTIYDIPDYVTVSENGQFFCTSSENGIEIFEINGTITNLLYTDTRQYKGAMFVPSQPNKLMLRVSSNIEIRQIPSFDLIHALDVTQYGAILCNIDPASMNLLYHQNDSLKVCKINNLAKTIFKIRSDQTTCKMFNNKLLTNTGISFDINPYLNH